MPGAVSFDLLERSCRGLSRQRTPEQAAVTGDQAVTEAQWPADQPRRVRERGTAWQQIEERGYGHPTRVHLSVGRHEVGRRVPALGLHASEELVSLGILEGDGPQP